MLREEVYRRLSDIVGRVCGICVRHIGNRHDQRCVEARSMLVQVLVQYGVSEQDIASMIGVTRQCVNKLKNEFDGRMKSFMFRSEWKEVQREISEEATNDLLKQ